MAGHAVRWQGTGSGVVFIWSQKSKNPENLLHFGGRKDNRGFTEYSQALLYLTRSIGTCSEKFNTFCAHSFRAT